MRKIACIAATAALIASLTGCGLDRSVTVSVDTDERVITLIPCPTEDSDNCYWDADIQGNGEGTSFVTLDGVTYYAADR